MRQVDKGVIELFHFIRTRGWYKIGGYDEIEMYCHDNKSERIIVNIFSGNIWYGGVWFSYESLIDYLISDKEHHE